MRQTIFPPRSSICWIIHYWKNRWHAPWLNIKLSAIGEQFRDKILYLLTATVWLTDTIWIWFFYPGRDMAVIFSLPMTGWTAHTVRFIRKYHKMKKAWNECLNASAFRAEFLLIALPKRRVPSMKVENWVILWLTDLARCWIIRIWSQPLLSAMEKLKPAPLPPHGIPINF